MRTLIILALLAAPAWGATSTTQWDVRITGNNANSGGFDPAVGVPGTDYSQQNSPQYVFADLTLVTATTFTSSGNPVVAGMVGNAIKIISAVSGTCTAGTYATIISQTAGTATVDQSLGTAGGVCNANLGGSLLTIPGLLTAESFQGANSPQVQAWVKSGTYTQTTTIQWNSSPWNAMIGYNTTHGDHGTPPLVTTATNSTVLWTSNNTGVYGGSTFINMNFSNTASVRAAGFDSNQVRTSAQFIDCTLDGFSSAISSSSAQSWAFTGILRTEIKNSTGIAVDWGGNASTGEEQLIIEDSWIHNSGSHALRPNGQIIRVIRSILSDNTGSGIADGANPPKIMYLESSDFVRNGGSGVVMAAMTTVGFSAQVTVRATNNIFYGNTVNGFSMQANLLPPSAPNWNNAYGGNGTNRVNIPVGTGDVTLTVSPFVSTTNFALNGTAGGGLACKNVGYPGTFPGGLSVSALDIGAVQTPAAVTHTTRSFVSR